jgi:hypothetical protein
VLRVEEMSCFEDVIDKAYFRVIESQGSMLVDLIINFEHDPYPIFI